MGRLHVIIDLRAGDDGRDLARAALDGGASVLQVRVKDATDRERLDLCTPIVELCDLHAATCIVNDRADIAIAVGAGGLHVGADDLPVPLARGLVGHGMVIGGTARTPGAALRLQTEGADYVGAGPVYATTTKAGLPTPIGLDGLRAIVEAVDIPVIAIAGITVDRVGDVLARGAYGVAVVGAIAQATDPERATADLVASLERG